MRIEARSIGVVESNGEVGFSNVPNQILKKSMQRGFSFNLLVLGERGVGVRSLVNSIYNSEVIPPSGKRGEGEEDGQIEEHNTVLKEGEIVFRLKVFVCRERSLEKASEFIGRRNEMYNRNNVGILREKIEDPRIHGCLFVISPLSFKGAEAALLKGVSEICSVIPVISKADTFLPEELLRYKAQIKEDILQAKIGIYAVCDKELREKVPFAVCGSSAFYSRNQKASRGRMYPWGFVDAESPELFDLTRLRGVLMERSLVDLRKKSVKYYRAWKEKRRLGEEGAIEKKEKDLLKQIEGVITRRLEEKRRVLERDEFEIDRAFGGLMEAIKAAKKEISKELIEEDLALKANSIQIK